MRKEIQDLLAKKDFSEGLLKLDDVSKVKDYFATEGNLKDVTDDEVKEVGSSLKNVVQKVSELPEDKLDISGGGGIIAAILAGLSGAAAYKTSQDCQYKTDKHSKNMDFLFSNAMKNQDCNLLDKNNLLNDSGEIKGWWNKS